MRTLKEGAHLGDDRSYDPGIHREQLDGLLRSVFPAAVWSGEEMRFVWTNDAFRRLYGGQSPVTDVLGMPSRGFLSDAGSAVHVQDAAYTGLPHAVTRYRHVDPDGNVRHWQLSFLPMPGRFAQPHDVLVIAVDTSTEVERKTRREARKDEVIRSLHVIQSALLSTLDAEEILQRVLLEATEALAADWGWFADRTGGAWRFRTVHGWPEEVVGRRFEEDRYSLPRLAAERGEVVSVGSFATAGGRERDLLERHDLGGFLLVPVTYAGEITGVMGFCWGTEPAMGAAHHELAERLKVSLSLALGNAREYAHERTLRHSMESAFRCVPEDVPGFEIGHLAYSASTGSAASGDFYGVFDLGDGGIGAFIGEAKGQGTRAAPTASFVRNALEGAVLEERGPAAALQRSDGILARRADERVASAFMASVDPREGSLTYSLAGHSSPVLLRAGAHPVLLDAAPSTVLGRGEGRFDERTTEFGPHDLLLMYTDGLVSARSRDDRQFGDERLLAAVASHSELDARRLPEALFSEVFSFTQGRLDDDLAMVALRTSAA